MVHTCERYIWRPTSTDLLEKAEENMLKGAKCKYEATFVELPDKNQIRTIKVGNHDDKCNIPLVLLHGFGAGLGFFILNLKKLSKKRNVYATDLLGFGRSSRPTFPDDPMEVEKMFVESIEQWRIKMGFEKINLLGHSFGGYIAALYSLGYPQYLNHLILADPWGFPELPEPEEVGLSTWKLALIKTVSYINPFSFLRAVGPLGPSLVRKLRGDIPLKYQHVFGEGDTSVSDYLYHCNAPDPSGETGFSNVSQYLGYSKNPLINRINDLDKKLPITVLYGEKSWVAKLFDFTSLEDEFSNQSYYDIKVVRNAGHHIFSDNPSDFNLYVNAACNIKAPANDFSFDSNFHLSSEPRQYTLESTGTIQMITSI